MMVVLFGCGTTSSEQTSSYEDSWESLAKHNEEPDWFKNAKFGIYFHWGVYTVPGRNTEWYPRNMHLKDNVVYKHHLKTYGDPADFGAAAAFLAGTRARYITGQNLLIDGGKYGGLL